MTAADEVDERERPERPHHERDHDGAGVGLRAAQAEERERKHEEDHERDRRPARVQIREVEERRRTVKEPLGRERDRRPARGGPVVGRGDDAAALYQNGDPGDPADDGRAHRRGAATDRPAPRTPYYEDREMRREHQNEHRERIESRDACEGISDEH